MFSFYSDARHRQIFPCNLLFFSASLMLTLAQQHVNDASRHSKEQRVDSSLCDDCGVLAKTKATWQAAGLRPDQTGPCLLDLFLFVLISGRV